MPTPRRKISNDSSIEPESKRQKSDRNTKDAKVTKVTTPPPKTKVSNVKTDTPRKNSPRKPLVMVKEPNLNLHPINSSPINIAAVKLFQKVKFFSSRFFF